MIKAKIASISLLLIICSSGLASFFILATNENSHSIIQSTTLKGNLEPQKSEIRNPKLSLQVKEDLPVITTTLPPVTSTIQSIDQSEGDTRLFWVANVSSWPYEFYELNFTLKVNGPHSLIYSNSTRPESEFINMNTSFESVVYPTLTDYFGLPPDIDGNGKIILLVFDIDAIPTPGVVVGFFYQLNQFPYKQNDYP
ncbi:MAG: hypothetical protein ACTSQ9_06875, partial [Candidatus Hodarchaeales archaeon]